LSKVIETSALVKVYGSRHGAVRALDGIDFNVEAGTITGLLGHNGAGKTTLLNILSGLLLPTSGSARVLGMDVVKDSKMIRRRTGLLPEGFSLYETDTAEENLKYIAALNDINGLEREKRIESALEVVGLHGMEDRRYSSFSRGMKQKLGIATLLVKDPEVFMLDEPTAGLDPEAAREFKDLMTRLSHEHGKTVLVSTHLLQEVAVLCTNITIITRGRIMLSGKVSDLRRELLEKTGYKIVLESRQREELVGNIRSIAGVQNIHEEGDLVTVEASRDIREDVAELALAKSLKITTIYCNQPSLEDIFMKYYEGRVS